MRNVVRISLYLCAHSIVIHTTFFSAYNNAMSLCGWWWWWWWCWRFVYRGIHIHRTTGYTNDLCMCVHIYRYIHIYTTHSHICASLVRNWVYCVFYEFLLQIAYLICMRQFTPIYMKAFLHCFVYAHAYYITFV